MSSGQPFNNSISHVTSGSPVSAANTSKPTRELEQRVNYLQEVIEATELNELLTKQNQLLHPDVEVGDAVYWDVDNTRFDRALAAVTVDNTTKALVYDATADCLGICLSKNSSTTGTIGLAGMTKVSATTLSNMTGGISTPGRYYLSAVSPGKLLMQKPPITVSVLYVLGPANDCETDSVIYIQPDVKNFLNDHIHYQIDLVAAPAGDHVPPTSGEGHEITNADSDKQGWLPADDAIFNSTAPSGAVYGYNISAHTEVSKIWPPVPTNAAIIELYQPNTAGPQQKIEGLERLSSEYVKIDANGIWWMTSCYNQVPWPTTLNNTASSSSSSSSSLSSSSSSSSEDGCPTDGSMRIVLSFLKMTFTNANNVVTSLRPATDALIEFKNSDGDDAVTGDLIADIDVTTGIEETEVRGGVALKELVDSSFKFKTGWMAEGLVAGSDEVILSGTHQELLDPTKAASSSNPTLHQGIVTVNVQLDTTERELNPQIVKLEDVLEREYKGITYLGFPTGKTTSIRLRYNVPPSGLPSNPELKIRALIFGRATGPFSAMTLGYYRIVKPTAGSPHSITTGDTAITFDVVTPSDDYDGIGTNLPADNIIEIESDTFTIAAGDTIFVDLQRASDALPAFESDIGLVRIGGIIVPGS